MTQDVERPKQSYYDNVLLVPEDAWSDIDFVRAPGAPTEPDQMRKFRMDVQSTCRVIVTFLKYDQKERNNFLLMLHKTADLGLRGPEYTLEGGFSNLSDIRERLVNHAYNIRDGIMHKYRNVMIAISIPCAFTGLSVYLLSINSVFYLPPPNNGIFNPEVAIVIAVFWIPAGAAIGAWVEFVFGVETLNYDRLLYFDPGRWKPQDRILITVVVAYVFSLFLASGAIQVGVGNILLNEFVSTRPYCSLVIGFVTGFSFAYVRDILYRLRPAERSGS